MSLSLLGIHTCRQLMYACMFFKNISIKMLVITHYTTVQGTPSYTG